MGASLQSLALPPRLLALLPEQDVARWPIPLEAVSPHLINAVVDLEDRSFLRHPGLSFRGLLRAGLANLASGGVKQGGSTITQQLVKVLLFKPEKRVSRKMLEAFLASLLEYRHSKREILEAYFNNAYLGQDGGISLVGVEAASRFYFAKPAAFLSLEEAALLAGMLAAPNRYNPLSHPGEARKRRQAALAALLREGHISPGQAQAAEQAPLPQRGWPLRWPLAAHFLDLLPAKPEGKDLFTTLDPVVQEAVGEGVEAGLRKLEAKLGPPWLGTDDPLQVAVVVVNRQGRVLALWGSRQGRPGEYNRALAARRPIGSLVKPFLVALALEQGYKLEDLLLDAPLEVQVGNQLWAPKNHDGRFWGSVTVAEALAHSRNVPMVRLGLQLGLGRVSALLRQLGFSPPDMPAQLLGAVEASPWEVARAFSVFLNRGVLLQPWACGQRGESQRVLAGETVQKVLAPLQEVVERGTAAGFAARCGRPLAGKTGTTDNRRDSWFVALRPGFLTVVWVGTDGNRETGLYGSSGAGVLWQEVDLRLPKAYKGGSWL
jgi:penicillin-binding protein 1B